VRRITEPAKAKAGEAVATTKASTTCAAPKKRNNWKKNTARERHSQAEIGKYPKELLVSKNLRKTFCHMT